jgi:amidase
LKFFLQQIFDLAEAEIFSHAEYVEARKRGRSLARKQGIDAVIKANNLDALVAPTGSPPWCTDLVNGDHFLGASSSVSAVAGYPIINVPAGFIFGLPVGISFMGRAFSEPTLIKLASGFEAVTNARRAPKLSSTDVQAASKDIRRLHQKRDVEMNWEKQRKIYAAARRRLPMIDVRGRL